MSRTIEEILFDFAKAYKDPDSDKRDEAIETAVENLSSKTTTFPVNWMFAEFRGYDYWSDGEIIFKKLIEQTFNSTNIPPTQ